MISSAWTTGRWVQVFVWVFGFHAMDPAALCREVLCLLKDPRGHKFPPSFHVSRLLFPPLFNSYAHRSRLASQQQRVGASLLPIHVRGQSFRMSSAKIGLRLTSVGRPIANNMPRPRSFIPFLSELLSRSWRMKLKMGFGHGFPSASNECPNLDPGFHSRALVVGWYYGVVY